jgi:transposase
MQERTFLRLGAVRESGTMQYGETSERRRRVSDGYSFTGFRAQATIRGVFGDQDVRIVTLDRRSKKPPAAAAAECKRLYDLPSGGFRIMLELSVRRVACHSCGTVKRERLDFRADNPHFTRRFAFYVGRRCRQASVRDVTAELKLTWDTVKALEMQYMRAQIERAGTPGPGAIGIDEIAVRKGRDYRIVASDLVRKRPI